MFDEVSSFAELERRISDLSTASERGDAFEVFAEAYLATTRSVQSREVWPFDTIPIPIKKQLRLDTGVDMELGFVWDLHEQAWQDMYSALVRYKAEHGDCNVPSNWPENKALPGWLSSQRTLRKSNKLSEERILLLNEVGFIWNLHEWEQSFLELSAFKDAHGDCDVPMKFPENPRLASWVSSQRSARKSGRLSEDRIKRLDELGFIWKKSQGRPKK